MKKIICLIAALVMLFALTTVANADTFNGTKVRENNADPNLFFHNGKYYLTQTGTSRIAVFETEHVNELNELTLSKNISYTAYLDGVVYDPTVTELFGEGASISGTWSPELHYFSEEQFPGMSGWYMFLALRKNTGDSSLVRMVVLKSMTDSPKGPYGHPTKGTKNYSQPVLDKNGNVWDEWACGQTTLTIPEGQYKGTYTMWVAEEGRGQSGSSGKFYQKIMIAKMKSPWQFDGEPGIVTTPTQSWEYAGASSTHPRVVEGATPVYGKNGEIFITYSGSGYWSDYGLGQLTWNGGDPLKTSSWVKLSTSRGNPIFSAVNAKNLRGAGHASFLTDTNGNGFICYHAYAYNAETDKKAASRDAYIEPYYIDYSASNGVSKGVIRIGKNGDGVPCDTASKITFNTSGSYLTSPDLYALGRTFSVTLNMVETGAEGFIIYKSTDGKVFDYLTTTTATKYVDKDVTEGETYYYRAYAYREEEISDVSETVSCKATTLAPYTEPPTLDGATVSIIVHAQDNYDAIRLYRSEDGESFEMIEEIEDFKNGDTIEFTDKVFANGTYHYAAVAVNNGYEYQSSTVSIEVTGIIAAPTLSVMVTRGTLFVCCDYLETYDSVKIYRSTDGETFEEFDTISENVAGIVGTADNDVIYNNTYYYYAVAYIDGNESTPSEVVSYRVRFLPAPDLDSVSYTCSQITLQWHNLNEGDVHIYRSVNDGDYTFLAVGSETEYIDKDITVGNSYNYKLKLVNEDKGLESEFGYGWAVVTPEHKEGLTKFSALEPTCTEEGYTEYYTCRYCDTVTRGKEVIPATGHSHELTEEEIPATTTSVGKTAVYACACGDSYGGEEIPMLEEEEVFTMTGDANGDGVIGMLDVLRTLKAIVMGDVEFNSLNADVDGDGEITIADVLAILSLALNK